MVTKFSTAPLTRPLLSQLSHEELIELLIHKQQQVEHLQQEIERLKLNQQSDSKTSSKPPSTDLLTKSEKPQPNPRKPSSKPKRKPGAQPGHRGTTRKGFERIDRTEPLRPSHCTHCGSNNLLSEPVSVTRQQVAQLVERPIEIVEYQRQSCQCGDCGQVSTAAWPCDIVPGQDLGISLQALLVWLGNKGHLSYAKQQELVWELGEVLIGLGTLHATNSRVAHSVRPPVEVLWKWAQHQSVVHVDETPWPVKGVKEWLWTASGALFCLFHAAGTRSRAELETMLGCTFEGVLCSDDYSVYNGYAVKAQQKCLAHLRRHFKKVIRLGHGNNAQLGQVFLALIDEAFKQHRVWRETQDESGYRNWAAAFKERVAKALKEWLPQAGYAAGLLLRSLKEKAAQWWYFLDHPQVPPDNNQAERSLRLAVTKRKVCGGSRSMARFAQTADLLSVIQTCVAQERSVMAFFQQVLKARVSPEVFMPSLIPKM